MSRGPVHEDDIAPITFLVNVRAAQVKAALVHQAHEIDEGPLAVAQSDLRRFNMHRDDPILDAVYSLEDGKFGALDINPQADRASGGSCCQDCVIDPARFHFDGALLFAVSAREE